MLPSCGGRRNDMPPFLKGKGKISFSAAPAHVEEVRFRTTHARVYDLLLDLVRAKDYFVITSNVDGMFLKNGFAPDRLFTPQGDYAIMQCRKPCENTTWATKPIIDQILPTVDPATQEATEPEVIPHCPNCGGPIEARDLHASLSPAYLNMKLPTNSRSRPRSRPQITRKKAARSFSFSSLTASSLGLG